MAKKKLKKTLVEQILTKAGITHQAHHFNGLEGQTPDELDRARIFKTLALKGDKTGPIIGVLSIEDHLSEKKLATISGNKKVQMIPQKDLEKTTGYIHGANNPVGIRQRHHFPIYIDDRALDFTSILVSAGEIGRSVQLSAQDLADFVGASFANFREKGEE
ncbi:aminoacyl-tRNA deacylase [Streptococcus sp. 121]|uniref:aminoacyl-tRNA deacylase n=1 Tax=Streptococcus sp. 121 TaxID=2797637 RepID=UPI0018F0688F|nr:aminoacyl-tRNA deacylase [Streptococcus sp. 121]MBJ6745491.1 aminoacyl-tRNA deacylase [Streptococcus sp. 121]